MTAPLDEKARDAALAAWFANTGQGWHAAMEAAIRAYLAASPSPSMEMEVGATAWEGYWPGAGSISSTTKLTKDKNTAARWQDDGAEIESLVRASQAQSALEAMRAERDEAWNKGYAARDGVVDACRAQVLRLTEENEALRKRTGPDMWCQSCGTVTRDDECDCNRFGEVIAEQRLVNLADELGRIAREVMEKRESAEARIKALEKALIPFAAITEVPALGYVTKEMVISARTALKENAL